MSLKSITKITKCTFSEFGEDNVTRLSAALAYYSMFSIGPLLVIAVGLAGFAFGHDTVRKELTDQLSGMIGTNATTMVESMMTAQNRGSGNADSKPGNTDSSMENPDSVAGNANSGPENADSGVGNSNSVVANANTQVGNQNSQAGNANSGAGKQKSSPEKPAARAGIITTLIGVVALLFGATGVFGQLQDSLNTIWGVKSKPGKGMLAFLRARFLSLSMVLGIGFLLLVSMALSTFLTAFTKSMGGFLPIPPVVAHTLNFLVSFGVITVLFAMIFKYLPDVKVPFRKVWVGAIGTALLFTIGKELLALYLGRASTSSAYGAAGSVIIIMMWVYYAALILFFGAEFTQVYARQTGARILPSEFAVPVTQEERAEQGMASHIPRGPRRPDGAPLKTPGLVVHKNPWQFAGMMAAAGFVGGALLRMKLLRKAANAYAMLHRH